jgi:hypothetical protein
MLARAVRISMRWEKVRSRWMTTTEVEKVWV